MTRPDLEAIRARCEAATPGPWRVDGSTYDEDCNEHLAPYGLEGPNERLIWSSGGGEYAHPDMATAQFIASARTDIPALLAYIEELESRTTYTIGETELAQRIATLEHMLTEERENVDTLRAAVEHAEQRFVDEYDAHQETRSLLTDLYMKQLRADAAQMREYGISYDGVRKLIAECVADEMNVGKVVELLRAAAHELAKEEIAEMKARIAVLEAMKP